MISLCEEEEKTLNNEDRFTSDSSSIQCGILGTTGFWSLAAAGLEWSLHPFDIRERFGAIASSIDILRNDTVSQSKVL